MTRLEAIGDFPRITMKTQIQYPGRLTRTIERYRRLVSTFVNWPAYLAFKWGWRGERSVLLKTRTGFAIEVPWHVRHAFKDIFLYGTYAHPEITARLPERPVVIDIGGNIGGFSLYALHLRPRARCLTFEPVGGNFRQLQANRNRNPQADWHLFNAAVAGTAGTIQMCSPTGSALATDAFMQRLHDGAQGAAASSETVEARTLENIFREENITHCDWLKVDCEGAEYEIFYQTPPELFQKVSAITLETHVVAGARNNTAALTDYLESLGFRIWLADDDVVYALRNG